MRLPTMARAVMRRAARAAGYEIRTAPRGDGFTAQKRLLQDVDVLTILDVGAYIGETAVRYRDLFSSAVIHCFEPFEPSYRELQRRVGSFAEVHKLGVGEDNARRQLNINQAPYTNSFLRSSPVSSAFVDPRLMTLVKDVSVDMVTLDAFCSDRAMDHVNILKLDIQGYELAALQGAVGLLSRHAIDLIYSEVNFAPLYTDQASVWELHEFLLSCDYRLAGFYQPIVSPNGSMSWADAIFISPLLPAPPESLWG